GERFRAHRRKVVDAAPWDQAPEPEPLLPTKPKVSVSTEDQPPNEPSAQASSGSSVKSPRPQPTTGAMRLALLYKRHAQPDEQLLGWLEDQFTGQGHQVFIDRHLTIGVEWAKELESQISQSEAVVVLLSAAS